MLFQISQNMNDSTKLCHADDEYCGRCGVIIGSKHFFKTKNPGKESRILDWADNSSPGESPIPFVKIGELRDEKSPFRCDDCYKQEQDGTKEAFIRKLAYKIKK